MKRALLTTIDNPFNPFTQFEDWYRFDEDHGYHTTSYLARIAKTSTEMSEEDYANQVSLAVDEILSLNILGIYRRVVEDETPDTPMGGASQIEAPGEGVS